jgi:hypothetical protein
MDQGQQEECQLRHAVSRRYPSEGQMKKEAKS